MIVLDTNVVSELMRPSPDPTVLTWVGHQASEQLWLTSMTAAELSSASRCFPTVHEDSVSGSRSTSC